MDSVGYPLDLPDPLFTVFVASTAALSAGQRGASTTVEAEKFVFRGRDGTKRAELAAADKGAALAFFDKAGKPRLVLDLADDRNVGLELFGSDGKVHLELQVDSDGSASLSEYRAGDDANPAVHIVTEKNGDSIVALFDKRHVFRLGLAATADNHVDLSVRDAEGKSIFHQGK